ncbi:MAG: HAMP domain-containing histidine kinase [Oscillospiraceae bacterium]|nr:HAMP domain-containing histidine kinase [Oscillospiraceae bacterium]
MFSKYRNITAWILLILSAFCWIYGLGIVQNERNGLTTDTTATETAETSLTITAPDDVLTEESTAVVTQTERQSGKQNAILLRALLIFCAAASAVIAIFILRQNTPVLGADGILLCLAIIGWLYFRFVMRNGESDNAPYSFLKLFAILFSIRELWGWIFSRMSLSWCMVYRLSRLATAPQISLLVCVGWIIVSAVVSLLTFMDFYNLYYPLSVAANRIPVWFVCLFSIAVSVILDVCCLWRYGSDLDHLQKQLDNFQKAQPITIKDGAFSQTETQLLEVQRQHEEAVRTAVSSERFKVELISNVSHDLRTPLTSILGYSELLQSESLSVEGKEQLTRLNQKAGYMRDLVESLFELTKVSSGVIESRKDEIDLIRLLEQTIGLFDDQLTEAGLVVRRNYSADSIPAITDGARMHQVFANLLGNAIKYALHGTRIYLDVTEADDNYRIRMTNTASYEMDFKPEEIMQRFARGDKARSTRGSGLGLAIAQTYTESVGGQFHVAIDGDQFSAVVTLPKTERDL